MPHTQNLDRVWYFLWYNILCIPVLVTFHRFDKNAVDVIFSLPVLNKHAYGYPKKGLDSTKNLGVHTAHMPQWKPAHP